MIRYLDHWATAAPIPDASTRAAACCPQMGGWTISGDFNIKDWDFQKALELNNNYYEASSLFSWLIMVDLKNSSRNSVVVDQNELTLSSRDFYLNKTMDDKVRQ
ncbi:endothelin-converting enzyme-like protein [Trichonephila inaurata madagascariensis]|uniref:Endothelin-converting enzyme-like protein n=1 Tax=Trichonephila inaurata madagascariensis TaxID=2747483 RepID=A0A8X6WWH3_9ARAC|nr:endothelin-converting enzyme-like protein [Trichonephila inaurata madagascariensis]